MSNSDVNQLDSMLSYVANRDGTRPPSFFDKEIRSWLMMATELVPSSIPINDGQQANNQTIPLPPLNPEQSVNPWEEDHDFHLAGSPYMQPHGGFSSPLTVPRNAMNDTRHNSIELLALPTAVVSDPPNMEPINSTSLFTPSNGLSDDIIQSLPLPTIPIESMKRTTPPEMMSPIEEDPELAKKRRRMEKNRQTAKTCRQRKKERKEAIQEEILKLREENMKLRQTVESMSDEKLIARQHAKKHKEFMDKIKACVRAQDEEGILKETNNYYTHWSQLGEERSTAAELHLEQLKMLLLPTQMSKMCLWSMGQEDEFYDEKLNNLKYGGSIWNILSQACGFTDEQKKAIISSRSGMLRQQENIASVLDIANNVQQRVRSNIESMHEQMRGILSVLTPTQQAKFLIWVEEGMNGSDILSSVQRVLKMQNQPTFEGDDISLSENESLSSISM